MTTSKPASKRDTADKRQEGIESKVEGFNDRGREAVKDRELHDSISLFTNKTLTGRNANFWALPNAPELREKAYRTKQETMANLDSYLAQMADAVEERGGNVFFANDGEDVVKYIGDLAWRKGAKIITKSKSMATEEIELNHRLEEDYADLGLEIVETDLGEWIAQLAGDTPSHIVGPILHMNKKRVTEILSGVAGEELPPDVSALGTFARQRLREKFVNADIGITGANFGVAETGTIATVTNEGNARLVTSVPPVHVVVMGIEKIIPKFEDLSTFVQLLGRSGTGQKITVYTNFITGPRGEEELDGAEEFHLILMDNGRSKLLGTEYEEALYCIRCGSCLNVCPVYRQTGGHAYGSTYSGPIGAVITPLLKGDREAKDLPYASSLCGACTETCPVGIPLHELLLKLRNRQVEEGMSSRAESLMFKGFERAMKTPAAYKAGAKVGKIAQKPVVKDGSIKGAPGVRAWTDFRELAPMADKSFRELWKEGI
ncbi:MAG: iron-sulfur cluster-binding protein [Rubrobacter sp.]|nr:iron-sulfur cluster-binding protein [Rubrobacter sp.]